MAAVERPELTVPVACPRCGAETTVPVPDADTELRIRRSVAAFGDRAAVTCAAGHDFWVYYC